MHLSDLHIGKTLGEFSLIDDQRYILDQILDIAEEKAADAVLIAGDVYDRAVPGEDAVRLFDAFISRLAEGKRKTFLISGNHDSDQRLSFGSRLFQANGLYISAGYQGELCRRELEDEYGKLNVYLLPFVKASQVRHFFPEEEIRDYDSAVRAALAHTELDKSGRNLLVAHQFVAGRGGDPVLGGSESAAVRAVGTVERIGADCFDDFDYVALGHIHSPQKVGREEVRYSGSPLKYSVSEVNNEKSVPVVTMGEKGDVSVELVRLKPLREMRHLKGKMEQLLDRGNRTDVEDFIYVTLTDEEVQQDAMGIFRQYYPNTVKLDYDNAYTREMGEADPGQDIEEKSFPELFSDFYRFVYGCDMSREEEQLINLVAGEAGVTDEAD